MGAKVVPNEEDSEPRKILWIKTIQLIIRGVIEIALELISRGRLPL